MRTLLPFFLIAVAVIGFFCGLSEGVSRGEQQGIRLNMEDETWRVATALQATDLAPQLREYLKARLYYVAADIPRRRRHPVIKDHGPISAEILGNIEPVPGLTATDLYERFRANGPR